MQRGTILGGRFAIEGAATKGGMGAVFRAIDRRDGAPVALKVLRGREDDDIARFAQETAILAALDHPAIVRYVDHGVCTDGRPWLAMEWLEGEDLAQRLTRGPLAVGEAVALVRRAAGALACAHAGGMIHRDLKPSNLFLPGGDVSRLKLVDFGIARVTGQARRTQTGVLLGTLGYVAPEQIQGGAALDARTDLFSLGCVLFECLAGRRAYDGEHFLAVLAKIVLQGQPRVRAYRPEVPEQLDDLVRRMLAKDPAQRPQDATALVAELDLVEAAVRIAPLIGVIEEVAPSLEPPSGRRAFASWPDMEGPSSAPSSLSGEEQRQVTVVLAGDAEVADHTLPSECALGPLPAELLAAVEPFGGRLDLHAGRAMVVTLWGNGDATDRMERAARCALALQDRAAELSICVVTGRGRASSRRVGGELIDRGVEALRATRPGIIVLDETTAGALGPSFCVEELGGERILTGERPLPEIEPLLLGRPSPCVGREREISMLEGILASCVSEHVAGAVLVSGALGVGKSHLRRALLDRLVQRRERVEVLTGCGDALSAGSPFGIIADAVRRAAGIRDGEPIASRRARLVQRAARCLPGAAATRVAAFLGELCGTPFPDEQDEALRAARNNPMLMADSVQTAWEDWLGAECAAHPVLLVLDDLQWADAATVRLVDTTLRNLGELPLMVLIFARPEVHARFPKLLGERDLAEIRLGPLSRRASEKLVTDALGAGTGAETVSRIIQRAGGNAFYLQELVRAVAAGRGEVFPASVLDAIEARLDAEGAEARRALRAASVFGDHFSRDGVNALCDVDPRAMGEWLERLAAHELIASAGSSAVPGDADYVFSHAAVREAAYATLVDADRELGHRLAGEWLERAGHTDAFIMAEHFRRGGRPDRAARWYHRAAEQALDASDLEAAIERAHRSAACGASPEELGALRSIQAEAHLWRGELTLAEERAVEAVERLPMGSVGWLRAVSRAALAAGKRGRIDRVQSWARAVSTVTPAPSAMGAWLICLSQCAGFLVFDGRYSIADRVILTIDLALGEGAASDAPTVAAIHQARSLRASAAGDLEACLDETAAALAAFEQAGDHRNACAMRTNLGFVHASLGDFACAETVLRTALAAAERMGLDNLAAAAIHELGRVLAHRGLLDEAALFQRRASEAFGPKGDPRMEGVACTLALASG